MSSGGMESIRARMNPYVDRMVWDENRNDLDSIVRTRKLEELGAHGTIVFGFYLTGLSDVDGFSLCDVAVGRDEVVFLDADPSAGPWSELGRIPREGVGVTVEDLPETQAVPNPEVAPNEPSFTTPGAIDVTSVVVVRWSGGELRFAFPDHDGAREAADNLKRQLNALA